ncbi:voltage-dependent T-type calcium channel subunit alpha-1H-like [Kryptolebias marmoratus]|uniref:voltage-dependent T-type calcium channel subunit alpha-1H-like n=1 Tax=Kryptolebias marmoratus TaxID=37003 RepID=UPI0007F92C72|nr:voltage-dependent T-type calcium channel subunit alpha-1H-like [Kryptolebias marmoratus]
MTDGEGRARFQYEECQEQAEVQDDVRLSIRSEPPGHDADPGGGPGEEKKEKEEDEEVVGEKGKRSCSRPREGVEWSSEVHEEKEPELEVEVGPTLGVRITAPIRDPDCVSEDEEQQPYPALAPVVFFCLKQTMRPRNWCLRMVCNPYPFIHWNSNPESW